MGIINGEKRECDKCDVEIKNKKVEPKESISGEITRTYLGPLFLCTKKVIQGYTSRILGYKPTIRNSSEKKYAYDILKVILPFF